MSYTKAARLVTALLPPEWLQAIPNIQEESTPAIPQTAPHSLHLSTFLRSTRSRTSPTIHLSLPIQISPSRVSSNKKRNLLRENED